MTEFFKALKDFKPSPPDDNFYMEVVNTEILSLCRKANNNTVKITQEEYKFLLDNGISNFIYNGSIEKKPKKNSHRVFPVLGKHDQGYSLQDNDPYWPKEIVEGGYTWQTPYE
jgi:hypothetical protein